MHDILLTATCSNEHEWDCWAEENDETSRIKVSSENLRCPECEPRVNAMTREVEYNMAVDIKRHEA